MTQACQRWAVRRSGVNIEAGGRGWCDRGGGERDVEEDQATTHGGQRGAVRRSGVDIEAGERVWEHRGVVTRPETKGGGGGKRDVEKEPTMTQEGKRWGGR